MCKNTVKPKIAGWPEALKDAERQLRRAKGKASSNLVNIIGIIKRKIEAGEPWPGDEKAGTVGKSVPANG
jgi:hypothetical protein